MTNPAEAMKEAAASLVENGFDSGAIDWSWRAIVNRSALKHIAGVIRALPLPEPAPDPEQPTATGVIAGTGESVSIFQESHDGWTARHAITGEWEIVDRSGWVLATVHYDYRFTSNATNHHRALLLASAPEQAATVARLSADLALTREALDRYAALDPDGARAVLAKLGGEQPARAPDLRAALAEARDALAPFATHADLYDDERVNKPDDFELGYGVGLMMQKTHAITVGHFRRARRARTKLAKLAEGA